MTTTPNVVFLLCHKASILSEAIYAIDKNWTIDRTLDCYFVRDNISPVEAFLTTGDCKTIHDLGISHARRGPNTIVPEITPTVCVEP